MTIATFAAGCFWGVEAAFQDLPGVMNTTVGYTDGTLANPSYEDVCSHKTGHAEVVRIEYDPDKISYEQLLAVFWQTHDPTQLNRQGPDIGDQYRSAIFFHTKEQEAQAIASKTAEEHSGKFNKPFATIIKPAPTFYKAEEYHQQYLKKRGEAACHFKS